MLRVDSQCVQSRFFNTYSGSEVEFHALCASCPFAQRQLGASSPLSTLFADWVPSLYGLSAAFKPFILPIGIVMGIFHLTFNLQFGRSPDLIANAFLCVGAILSHALTGWITGIAFTLCFNFIAQKNGGIDAKFVSVANGDSLCLPLKAE
jgi:hypothetical protein